MNDIGRFIERFRKEEDVESLFSGNCSYWFAVILYHRFIRDGAKIMFYPNTNRFGTMVHGKIYDITGMLNDKRGWIPWLNVDRNIKETITNQYIMF